METVKTDAVSAAQAVPVEASSVNSGGATSSYDWTKDIPFDYRNDKIWETTFKGKALPDVLKSTAEAQRMIGSSIRLPNERDKPEERSRRMNEIYTKLGRPNTAEEYGPLKPQNIGAHVEWDDVFEGDFKSAAHMLGLNREQANGVMAMIADHINKNIPNPQIQAKQTVDTLTAEWGEHGFAQNVTYGNRAVEAYGGKEFITLLNQTGLGNDPVFVRVFAKIGRELAESGAISGEISTGDAKSEVDAMMKDKDHAYWNRTNPDHESAVERMLDLQRSMALTS